MTDKKLSPRVAAVGAGHWGKNIVRNLHQLGALAGICETDADLRDSIAGQYPDTPVSGDIGDFLNRDDIDAVAIATPAATHGALVERALRAGKHVFVEKPLCLDVAEGERLKSLAAEQGFVLMVGHLLLYHPAFRALKATVEAGELGTLRYIYSNRASLGRIRREENALWSFAPHDISMILALTGRLPRRVVCNGEQYLTDGVADTSLTHLDFGDKLQAHIFVSWLHPYKDHRLVVVGEKGMAVFNDVQAGPEKLLLYPHNAEWDGQIPVINKADARPIPHADDEPLKSECQAFLDAIAGRQAPPSDGAEGVRVLRVLDACQRSLVSGQPVGL